MNRCFLGDIAISQTGPFGSQLHEKDYVEEGTPIVTVEHLGDIGFTTQNLPFVSEEDTERLSKYLLQEGDIVFSRVGSIDRCVYVEKEQAGWLFSGRCLRVRCDKAKVNPRYLSYYFKLPEFKKMMMNISVGATMPSLNTKLMDSIKLILLNRSEQDRVAEFLGNIDAKIEINNKINEQLELMAKSIYNYWFLQFDFPDKNGKPYKSSGGKMIWNGELNREIPAGWEVSNVEHFGRLSNGINYDKNIIGDKIYKIINVRNISSTTLLLDKCKIEDIQLSEKIADKFLLKENDILIARSGIPGAVRVLISDIKDTIFCGFIICLSLSSRFYRDYLVYMLKDYENTSATTSGGTIMQNVSQETIKRLRFPVPDEGIIQLFNKKIDVIWKSMQQKMEENQELIALRDFLLPLLMNRQVGFKEEYKGGNTL